MELNPGPRSNSTTEMFQKLQDGQSAFLNKLAKIEDQQAKIESLLSEHGKRMDAMESKILKIEETAVEISRVRGEIQRHFMMVDDIAQKLDDLTNHGCRLNLLFFGLNDTNLRESWETSEQIVRALCTDKLGIEIGTVQRAHRIGRHRPNKKRPVIANFLNYNDTECVLGKCAALEGTPYSVSRDFSPRVRDIRRRLWAIGQEKKKNSPTEKFALAYDKIIINGDTDVWDDSSESVKKLAKQ